MTSSALYLPKSTAPRLHSAIVRQAPVIVTVFVLIAIWYVAAVLMNVALVRDAFEREETRYTVGDLIATSLKFERPRLPALHQILATFTDDVFGYPVTSARSLVYHSWVTLSATVVGFLLGAVAGVILATLIVHLRTLQKSLLPWIICSQMVPILAVAPIVIVVLGAIGIRGLLPKSIISAYLCFFPVAIGMVKGLSSPDPIQRDLMRTWSATSAQVFWKLRWPAAIPYLFASLKVAITISLIGAIVGELPTGAQAGIGARLLAGSYYGQTVQIWAALLAASLLAACLVGLVGSTERWVGRRMGSRP
jgi:NitT/TauT family transport system permease protein